VSVERAALISWYRRERRDLPWRSTRDPYAIWLSETMLQQTRVETVIPYYRRFLDRFPDVAALASADLEEVYAEWAGLGYYSRARHLHAAARQVLERFAGRLPGDSAELQSLPGVGRYTAGAVASIAFDRPEPVVDGNVERVLARALGIREDVRRPDTRRRLWEEAAALAAGSAPGDLNQALMELGATVCTPRAPRCEACPLAPGCDAVAAGDAESLPRKPRKAPPRAARAVAGLVLRRGRLLAVQRPPGGLLGGLWELPGGEPDRGEGLERALARTLRERVGLEVGQLEPAGSLEHVFTHRRLRLHLYRCGTVRGRVRLHGFDRHRWVSPAEARAVSQSALMRRALALAWPAGGAA